MSLVTEFPRRSLWRLAPACLLPFLCASCTMVVHTAVHDQAGKPLRDAVVYATPRERRLTPPSPRPKAAMVVENLAFKPPVLPVRLGSGVTFVNRDNIKHQFYSISAAKNFQLSVDRYSSSAEVVFDKAGVVVLGSAIHDGMIGHIYVLQTPYFATTGADGTASIEDLPRGAYEVRVWHPAAKASARPATRRVADSPTHRVDTDFSVTVQPDRPPQRVPSPDAGPTERDD